MLTEHMVYLVKPGQGYEPLDLPQFGLRVNPGALFVVAPKVARELQKRFPDQVVKVVPNTPAEVVAIDELYPEPVREKKKRTK